jgi:Ca2+/Na+ antiporter
MLNKVKSYLTDPGFIVASLIIVVVGAWFIVPAANKLRAQVTPSA